MQQTLPGLDPAQAKAAPVTRKVLIAGATGLVGGLILQGLIEDATVGEVHALVRRELAVRHPKLFTHVIDFKSIPALPPVDEVYLALGTTIRQAGSRAAFRAVDFDANLAVARAALMSGAKRIGLVSAYSANAGASIFYTRVKGELEDALNLLSTETLVIARPSFLLGDRDALKQPSRYGEKMGIWLSKLLNPLLPANYRPVEARKVANGLLAMVPSCHGKMILLSKDIQHFDTPSSIR
ncbi:nucleoside-diphosphate sugar epimerase [Undibacterium sp. CY18W]|uniref:Nucleoside-diphosphate sugar epimerase n=1 Tax=Undibacterium hunanense TaxID=2762292 RepID=A0ABR6ZLH2_9BURK|nr:nucleoside-diphosphate sugar epimerase [Undibacterium hunanense]MBC3916736.1 nucleoside-diphosphate sugar epimerase [Undibacterium hunanense]